METTVLHARLASIVILLRRERSNRLMSLDAATAAMAHELRQPLTGIGSSAYAGLNWLRKSPPDLDKVQACLESIGASKRRAADIITSVRELFKRRADHRAMVHVDDVARQVLNLVQQDLRFNDVSVSAEFCADLPAVHADRTQLQQVILNLIRNSIDAMEVTPRRARRLGLVTSVDGHSSVVLSVRDSGPGIAAEHADRVFDPFFTTKPAGLGLGLPICQTIIEEHGGQLRLPKVDSGGCVFEIVLPIAGSGDNAVET
jgi:C4-dicarboxylate-specific signal transduction histidine kinase